MISNYPHGACYSPGIQPVSNTPPMRSSYYVSRNPSSPERPYCVVPYYSYQMVPMYYMPVPYVGNEKRSVSLTSSSSPGDYIPSDVDLSNGWEYQAESDWSPQYEAENNESDWSPQYEAENNEVIFPCPDWGRHDEVSSQDLSPQHSVSPLTEHIASDFDLETKLHQTDINTHHGHSSSELPVRHNTETPVVYSRDAILKYKFLRSDDRTREKLDHLESPCIQTLFSSTSTFSECADAIIYRHDFSIPALISAFEDMMEEWSVEPDQTPWFVLRVLIFVRYKKGDSFNPTLVTNGKSVYEHFITQSHSHLQAKIRNECMSALKDEESSLKFSGSYQEFASFIPEA